MADPMRQAAEEVLRALLDAGFESYFAGGAVRDLAMGLEPSDYDIATAALPDEVIAHFPKTIAVGASFGVVVVLHRGFQLEVATFRTDGDYVDGRRPETVTFTSAIEDVKRRDFTINALLYDVRTDAIIDHVGGQDDIAARRIRCVGDPPTRFEEDRLRMLRAVRFAARFDFAIEEATWQAIVQLAPRVTSVSRERITAELRKMLADARPGDALRLLFSSGLLAVVLPEVTGAAEPMGVDALIRVVEALHEPTAELSFAALCHLLEPATLAALTERLRLSRAEQKRIAAIVALQAPLVDARHLPRAPLRRLLRDEAVDEALELHRARRLVAGGDLDTYQFCRARLAALSESDLWPPRLLTGHDVLALGHPGGPALGEILAELEDAQLAGEVQTVEQAERWVTRRLGVDKKT